MTSDVVTADRNCVLNRVGDSLWRQTLHLLFVYRNHHHSRSDDQDFVSSISPLCDESVDQESLLFLTVDSQKKKQSSIVSRRPRRLAYGRRIRCMRRRVIVDLASAGPLEVKFIITLRRSTPVIEYRRFELGPPGESKLPLSNRKYTDFLKILNNRISIVPGIVFGFL